MKKKNRAASGSNRTYTYETIIAHWWQERAGDAPHQYAYKNIAEFLRSSLPREPRLIIDYACGAGHLLSRLSLRFTNSRLIGLDGSANLLELAETRFSRLPRQCVERIALVRTSLPNRNLMRGRANLVVFCFPNMMPFSPEQGRAATLLLCQKDREIAGILADIAVPGQNKRGKAEAKDVRHSLEYGRSISLNMRQLLVRGGICVRVEYATTQRHEWSEAEMQRVCFEEGTLDARVDGIKPQIWFRVLASAFFRSRVVEDVYQQTGDERDCKGGYLLTVLRAV